MGVPAFFRWLSKKYPSIVVHSVEEKPCQVIPDEPPVPVDITKPNPNNIEFDNLYLDMNGIIHPCTHPENKPAPKNESEMFVAIFEYMDRLMAICRPRRLLYMAIDGVAPRAKMNQQRSRRFRAAQETREKKKILGRLREEVISRGSYLPPEKKESEYFDSNCITPGTPFMSRLADAIRFYVHKRLHEDSGWRNLQVILSDSNVPGEGEHKIMDFIRRQRGMPDHDPNTRHCLCGADADLIMLGLATHEPHFTIIREEFKPNQPRPCDLCSHFGHEAKNCIGLLAPCDNDREVEDESQSAALGLDTEFIFIRIDILREYLEKDLQMHNLPFPFDLERAIDDWVLMCFFVGNDFLPHLPSLEIRENAIDRLMGLYKKTVYKTNGWLSDSGIVNLNRLALIMQDLGTMEDEIFQRRRSGELNFRKRERQNRGNDRFKRQRAENRPKYAPQSGFCAPTPLLGRDSGRQSHTNPQYLPQSNETAAQALKAMLKEVRMGTDTLSQEASGSRKRKWEEEAPEPTEVAEEEELDEFEKSDRDDVVRLWEGGWRERYYSSKFGVDVKENPEFPSQIAYHYVCGIAWVLSYYYQGCVSWKWYFPFHYAPFASDFSNVDQIKLPFRNYQKGISNVGDDVPFDPLQQLMAVFPADSSDHVPPAWRDLMSDPKSPIIDQYPIRFRVDLNGKRFLWQGVALLPFVDEVRLKAAVAARYHLLTADELKRNERGSDSYFVRSGHPFAALLISESVVKTAETEAEEEIQESRQQIIDPQLTSGISGRYIHLKESEAEQWLHNGRVVTPLPDGTIGYESIVQCQAIQVKYWDPSYSSDHIFQARLLPKVTLPSKILKPRENEHRPDWRPQLGFGPPDSGFRSRMPVNHHPNNQPYAYNPVVAQRMVQRSVPWEQPARGWRPPPMAYQQGYGDEHHRSYHQDSRNYDYPQYYPPRPRGFPPGDRFYQPRRNFRGDRHY